MNSVIMNVVTLLITMSERLDRIEAESDRILGVQRELQNSQLRLQENQLRLQENQQGQEERINRLVETTERNSQAIASLVNVVTVHQDSMEQLKRTLDYLLSKDGNV
ncbi:MAG: hypothetical protein AAGB01_03430 [Cyanobacteria bacterium P01_F01_bin.42]